MADVTVSQLDIDHLAIIRENVARFMRRAALYATQPGRLLDIAPQIHEGARPFFPRSIIVETFDIDPAAHCTYTGDICQHNDFLADRSYDYIVCTEVLEHTLQPFRAADEIWRLLKPGGKLFVSTPFNFRIHGPLPDCWRFTEHGLRALLAKFHIIELQEIATPGRDLMPIHYTVVAEK
jgi:SAM-dependent methyltransferase